MMAKSLVYLESSIPSYAIVKDNPNITVTAHQYTTREWLQDAHLNYTLYVSTLVLTEITRGQADLAVQRLEIVRHMPVLEISEPILELSQIYMQRLSLQHAPADAIHMAAASVHKMDFLVTWNCKHIANGHIIQRLMKINAEIGHHTPLIVTPEQLLNDPNSEEN